MTSASSSSSPAAARSSANHGVPAPLTLMTGGRSCRTSSRAATFRSGATASSRSATTASAADASAFTSFDSSEPGAKSSERRGASATVRPLCQTFGGGVKPPENTLLLDSRSEVRHKGLYSVVRVGRSWLEGGRVRRVRRLRRAAAEGSARPGARSGRGRPRHPRLRPQPSRRRRPRRGLALPGRAAVRPRRRGRRPHQRARRGRHRLGGRRAGDAVPDGHLRPLHLLQDGPRVALPRGRIHQLLHLGRLRRAARVLDPPPDPRPRGAVRRGCSGDARLPSGPRGTCSSPAAGSGRARR